MTNLVKFDLLNGRAVWLCSTHVASVEELHSGGSMVETVGGRTYELRASADDVIDALYGDGNDEADESTEQPS